MVAVVVGSRLGVEQTSGWVLGSRGQLGQATLGRGGENVFVNAATGNLMLNNRDEFLLGQGADGAIVRSYNSLSSADGDNGDGWRISRALSALTGTVNTAGSTITRTDWDGSQVVYTYVNATVGYQTTEGAGAYDRLSWSTSTSTWTWTDGDSQYTETYADPGATGVFRITSRKDTDGLGLTFDYNADGYLSRVTTQTVDGHPEYTDFIYGTGDAKADLLELRTSYWDAATSSNKTETRTRYAYDSLHRLVSVAVDMTPGDNSITDGKAYVTTYTYDGVSDRVASIRQTDGSRIDITYESSGAFRVTSITQTVDAGTARTTSFTYGTLTTTVTGPDGLATVMEYFADGQLKKLTEPAATAGGAVQVREFEYDVYGNVTLIKSAPNVWTQFVYDDVNGDGTGGDHNGLWTRQWVREGASGYLASERTYNARNAVLTETRYTGYDADGRDGTAQPTGALTTRYVYDSENHLAYVISATGSVTKYDYNPSGNLIRTISYTGAAYSLTGLTDKQSPALATMNTWVTNIVDKTQAQITEVVYDFRGAVKTTYAYAEVTTSGGANGGGIKTTTQYVYDQHGRLTSRYVVGVSGVESFVYDGLDRVISSVDFSGALTTSAFYDAASTTVVTNAQGLNRISVYNRAGEVVSFTETTRAYNQIDLSGWPISAPPSGPAVVPGWPTSPAYSADAQWAVVDGPDGRPVVAMQSGQVATNINGGGAYTSSSPVDTTKAQEFVFYFRKSDLTRHGLYFGLNEGVGGVAYVENGTTGADTTNPYFFTASAAAQQTMFQADRWYKVVGYVLPQGSALVTAGSLGGVYDMTTGAKVASTTTFRWNDVRPAGDTAYARYFNYNDETNLGFSTYFYQPEIRQIPADQINVPVTATQYRYDVQGRLRVVVDETGAATHHLYDRLGRKVADIEADGSLVEYQYDVYDRPIATIRYATKVNVAALTDAAGNPLPVELSSVRPAADLADTWNWTVYDLAGRVVETLDSAGAAVTFTYDGAGRLVSSRAYANAFNAAAIASFKVAVARPPQALQIPATNNNDRVTRYFYDADGRQIGTLTADGRAPGSTSAEGYFSRIVYDQAGRVVRTEAFAEKIVDSTLLNSGSYDALLAEVSSPTNTADIGSWSVYDGRGFLRGTVNGEGEVTLYDYSPLGHLTQVVRGRKLAAVPTSQPTLAALTAAPASPTLETVNYTRNAYGQVLTEARVLASGTETVTYVYDALRRLVSTTTDRVTGADYGTRQRYDVQGRLIGQLAGEGVAALLALGGSPTAAQIDSVYRQWGVTFAYDDADRLISRTDADGVNGAGHKTLYFYDADGNLAYQVNALGEVVGYAYDAQNRRTETIVFGARISVAGLKGGLSLTGLPSRTSLSAADSRTLMRYNASGTVKEIEQRLSPTEAILTSFTYNAFGEVTKRTDDKGTSTTALTSDTTFAYDLRGLVTQVIENAGAGELNRTTTTVYDAFGRAVQTTDPRGAVRNTEYDRAGRVHVQYGPLINGQRSKTTYEYDARGNVLTIEQNNKTTTFAHNAFSRQVTMTTAEGLVTTTTYDDQGHVLTLTDGGGRTATYAYDLNGALKTTTQGSASDGSLGVDSNTYDSAGRVYETVDASGVRTRYSYDAAGRVLTQAVDPTGQNLITTYAYDAKGQRISVTDPSGVTTAYEFDLAGRQTKVTRDPVGQALATIYEYDHAGNVISVREAANSAAERKTVYTYDKLGRRKTEQVEPTSLNILTTYAYDLNGNVVTRTDKVDATTSVVTRYVYDLENRLTWSVNPAGGVSRTYYDADGRVVRTIGYATALTAAQVSGLGATPTEAGILAVLTASTAQDSSTAYVYDDDGRLVFALDAAGQLTETIYDGSGNAIRQIRYATAYTASQTPTESALRTWTASNAGAADFITRAVYDAAGRQAYGIDAAGAVTSYVYDAAGRVIRSVRHAVAHTVAGDRTPAQMDAWVLANGNASADLVTRAVYDAAGRQAFGIDAAGTVTSYVYDAAGRVIRTVQHAVAHTVAGDRTKAQMDAWVVANPSTADRITRAVYDAAGRQAYGIDAAGAVTTYVYDAAGRVIRTVQHAVAHTVAGDRTKAQMDAWVAANPSTADRTTRLVYDAAGRQAYSIDTAGAVTSYIYDATGRVIRTVRHAVLHAVAGDRTQAQMDVWATDNVNAADRTTRAVYDAAGRQAYSIDAAGAVTTYVYDGAGRVVRSIQYAVLHTVAGDRTKAQMDAWIASNGGAADRKTHFAYDAAGRSTFTVDAAGYVSRTVYDTAGRVTSQSRFSQTVSVSDGVTHATLTGLVASAAAATYTYAYDAAGRRTTSTDPLTGQTVTEFDALGRQVKVTDPRGAVGYFYYDTAGRLTLQIDPERYATRTTYNVSGEVVGVTRYATKVTGTLTVGTPPTVTTSSADATTTIERDGLDRVTKTIDAEGFSETYTLDVFGDRVSVTNKLGGVTAYVYDARGQKVSEKITFKVGVAPIENRFSYNAFGDLSTTTEAFGLTEQRTTGYRYDALGRMVEKTGQSLTVTSSVDFTTSAVIPTETIAYDAFGNVTETKNAGGARTLFYYDLLNRKISELDAAGTLREWTYDARNNALTERVYGVAIALPTSPGGTRPTGGSDYRETSYVYDLNNRLTHTTVANLRIGEYGTGYTSTASTSVTVENRYDAAGNLVQRIDGRGLSSYAFYDLLGRQTAQVDAEGYLTTYVRDAEGNVTQEVRYAVKVSGAVTSTRDPSTLPPRSATAALGDRITDFEYDQNGRRLSETRRGVEVYTSAVGDADRMTVADARITYAYDGLGNVTQKVEANGDTFDFEYDKMGRLTRELDAAFVDYLGATVRHETARTYNGLSAVSEIREGAEGALQSAAARVSTFVYGEGGRLQSATDATGFTRTFGYDAMGRVTQESYVRVQSGGVAAVTEGRRYAYDILGRLTSESGGTMNVSNVWTFGDARSTVYNGYGEVAEKRLNGVLQEKFDYDAGGRVWRSTAGDGVVRFFVHDANGAVTLSIQSAGLNLSTATLDQAIGYVSTAGVIDGGTGTGVVATFQRYDGRGMLTATIEPKRQLSQDLTTLAYTTATLSRSRAYNAFGEVVSETDARGYTTDFVYNTMGRILEQISPEVAYTDEQGVVRNTRPTEQRRYDLSGRLVATRNANEFWTTRTLVAGTGHGDEEVIVASQLHADGGLLSYGVDVFGDIRKITNQLGNVTENTYDKAGRLIEVKHPKRLAGSAGNPGATDIQLVDHYEYDGLGQRIAHWNSQFGSGVLERTRYDLEGRVLSQIDFADREMLYTYAWDDTISTGALGTFGGYVRTTKNVATNKTGIEKFDTFGRLVGKTDLGGRVYTMGFDSAGRQVTQTSSAGQSLTWAWYNTGWMAEQKDIAGNAVAYSSSNTRANYGYDANGNRTSERYATTEWTYLYDPILVWEPEAPTPPEEPTVIETTTVRQDGRATYDALGRMTEFRDLVISTTDPTKVLYTYDRNSNLRSTKATYWTAQGALSPVSREHWYKYDSMDRFVIADGQLNGGQIVGGTQLTYDAAGNRKTLYSNMSVKTDIVIDSYWEYRPGGVLTIPEDPWNGQGTPPAGYEQVFVYDYRGGTRIEQYDYTADGYLGRVMVSDPVWNTVTDQVEQGIFKRYAEDQRDAMGRLLVHREYAAGDNVVTHERTASYDNAGLIQSETTKTLADYLGGSGQDYISEQTTTYNYNMETSPGSGSWTGQFIGTVTRATTTSKKTMVVGGAVTNLPSSQMTYGYVWWDDARQSKITYDSDTGTGSNDIYTSTFGYDVNGKLSHVNIKDGRARNVLFVTDVNGQVLDRRETTGNPNTAPWDRYYYFNGVRVGEITNHEGFVPSTYLSTVTSRTTPPPASTPPYTFHTSGSADFDQAYEALTPGSVRNGATNWTVKEGDTLQGIAAAVWGDAALWYLIAEANGLTSASVLTPGQTVVVPAKFGNVHNNADTFKPYDPNAAIGDVNPTQPKPPAKPNKGCGVVGQIIAIAIAAVVSSFTGGLAGLFLGNLVSGLGLTGMAATIASGLASVAGAMIGGAIGSIASQGFLIATGAQDSFNWKAVGISAISAGVSKGLSVTGFDKLAHVLAGGNVHIAQGITGATSNALTQGISKAAGLQERFSWTDVAVAGVSSAAGSWLSSEFGVSLNEKAAGYKPQEDWDLKDWGKSLAAKVGTGAAAAATRTVLGRGSFGDNFIAELPGAIGSTIGDMIIGQLPAIPAPKEDFGNLGDTWLAVGDFFGLDGKFGYGGPGGPDGRGRNLSLNGVPRAVGDFLKGGVAGVDPSRPSTAVRRQYDEIPLPRLPISEGDAVEGSLALQNVGSDLRYWKGLIPGKSDIVEMLFDDLAGFISNPKSYAVGKVGAILDAIAPIEILYNLYRFATGGAENTVLVSEVAVFPDRWEAQVEGPNGERYYVTTSDRGYAHYDKDYQMLSSRSSSDMLVQLWDELGGVINLEDDAMRERTQGIPLAEAILGIAQLPIDFRGKGGTVRGLGVEISKDAVLDWLTSKAVEETILMEATYELRWMQLDYEATYGPVAPPADWRPPVPGTPAAPYARWTMDQIREAHRGQ